MDHRGWSGWSEIKTLSTEEEKAQTTAHNHVLVHKVGWPHRLVGDWLCDICQEGYKKVDLSWHCDFCGFDLCEPCFPKYVTNGTFAFSFTKQTSTVPYKPLENSSSSSSSSSSSTSVARSSTSVAADIDTKGRMTTSHQHPLVYKIAYDKTKNWGCDNCASHHTFKDMSWHCAPCGYDLCDPCFAKYAVPVATSSSSSLLSWAKQALMSSPTGPSLTPQHPHPLSYVVPYPKKRIGSWQCDICTIHHRPSTKSWHCEECGYDMCVTCFSKFMAK